MPHQCVHCKKFIPVGSKELLEGCNDCGGHFFFYISDENLEKSKETIVDIPPEDKKKVEKDIREIAGIIEEDIPVILDIESVRVTGAGKFEIDLVNLFKRDRPLIYKLEEGKYIVDLASTLKQSASSFKEIRDPYKFEKEFKEKDKRIKNNEEYLDLRENNEDEEDVNEEIVSEEK